ncbi:MAG: PEP/pyruvate-binding domain-containing protein [Desulfosarcinaceae bacterium]|nr:PEP/pyruvate-binding domain-containing protein [Desulfosarcinaceae bacterium]
MPLYQRLKFWTQQLTAPGSVLKARYAAFKRLLAHDKRAHDLMAELEEIFYQRRQRDFTAIQALTRDLSHMVGKIIADLAQVCPGRYTDLNLFHGKIDAYLRYMTAPEAPASAPPYTLDLEAVGDDDLPLVGGKALNLAIVRNRLKLPVPKGFAITTTAQQHLFAHNGLRQQIDAHLAMIDAQDTASLEAAAAEIQARILAAEVPGELAAPLEDARRKLATDGRRSPLVALRSSAVGEDGQTSFAGQFLSVLNVADDALISTYKRILASKYAPQAIAYRIHHGLTDLETPMAVLVVEMVAAASSGILYTADPEAPAADRMVVHGIWGLGELLVSGRTAADVFQVAKAPPHAVLEQRPAIQSHQMVGTSAGGTVDSPLASAKAGVLCLTDAQVSQLAHWGAALEAHFAQPQDVEWAADPSGALYLLQTRPFHGAAALAERPTCSFEALSARRLIHAGQCAAGGIAAGPIFNTAVGERLHGIPRGSVLVAASALPRYAKVMDRLGAIVTAAGSTAGHLATVAREFGVPMLVNVDGAGERLVHGRTVTVHADDASVYDGQVAEMLASPCARENADTEIDTPFRRKLAYILSFVATLDLVDPQNDTFTPRHCRSLHDIIRFAHEKAVAAMFHISDNRLRKLGMAKKLSSRIPMLFYILDVGGGLADTVADQKEVPIEAVRNTAMRAVWQGLSHPDIEWGDFSHFDWEAHDRMVMSGGIASPESAMFASHAVISEDYMNLNLRFGYHFVIVDAVCAADEQTILFRFSGGGADLDQRLLRARFLRQVLRRLGFDVQIKSDLIDGEFKGPNDAGGLRRLEMLGRLLGATRLMDMYLKDADQIDGFVTDFMAGRYHFATVPLT